MSNINNRFVHLKKKPDLSREEFIQGAEQENNTVVAKIKPCTKDVLLSVTGKINREKYCGKPMLVYLKKDLEDDMKKYCYGNKTSTINYLVRRGLDALIGDNKLILHMEED